MQARARSYWMCAPTSSGACSHVAGATEIVCRVDCALRRDPERGAWRRPRRFGDLPIGPFARRWRRGLLTTMKRRQRRWQSHIAGGMNAWQTDGLAEIADRDRRVRSNWNVCKSASRRAPTQGRKVLTGLLVPTARAAACLISWAPVLVVTGFLNWCGLGVVLGKMPWNRARGDERERSLS